MLDLWAAPLQTGNTTEQKWNTGSPIASLKKNVTLIIQTPSTLHFYFGGKQNYTNTQYNLFLWFMGKIKTFSPLNKRIHSLFYHESHDTRSIIAFLMCLQYLYCCDPPRIGLFSPRYVNFRSIRKVWVIISSSRSPRWDFLTSFSDLFVFSLRH